MDLSVDPSVTSAIAVADVARGWRQLTNTYGFCEEARHNVDGNQILRIQAALRAWPNWAGSRLTQYPANVFGLLDCDWGRVELKRQDLCIKIDLENVRSQILPRSGLPGIYQQPTRVESHDRIGFWLSLLVVFSNTQTVEYPDIIERDTQFFMGGRPGSSRGH